MRGMMVVFRPDGAEEITPIKGQPPALETLQKKVGGYLEVVPHFSRITHGGREHSCVALCNEEGKSLGLPINMPATTLWETELKKSGRSLFVSGSLRDYLVGNVVVIYGDDELMASL